MSVWFAIPSSKYVKQSKTAYIVVSNNDQDENLRRFNNIRLSVRPPERQSAQSAAQSDTQIDAQSDTYFL